MVIYRTGEPPVRAVATRAYAGINDGLVILTLSCGHEWAGLTSEFGHQTERVCVQCVSRMVDDDEWTRMQRERITGQMSMWGIAS